MSQLEYYKNMSLIDIEGEIWKSILGFENMYEVSNYARVKSLSRLIRKSKKVGNIISKDIILKQRKDKDGYLMLGLNKNSKFYTVKVHRLVAQEFIPNHENKPNVNHKNGIKNDNRVENLEWCTESENSIHCYRVLKRKGSNLGRLGVKNKNSKKVNQYSLDGVFIKKWDSVSDISRELNITHSCISRVCNGNYTTNNYAGFIWKYI